MMGEMLTMQLSLTHLETKVYPSQLLVHRNCDQRGGWQFSSKGERGVQKPVLFFPCKDPVYLWNFSENIGKQLRLVPGRAAAWLMEWVRRHN